MKAVEVKARKAKVGDRVYTVTATDFEDNAVTYSMVQSPDSGYFTINSGKHKARLAS